MSDFPKANIRIRVDPTNPGQFFACCGLLELANRVSPGAEGWFEEDSFNITCDIELDKLLAILVMDIPKEVTKLPNGVSVKPLIAPLYLSYNKGGSELLTLDAWVTVVLERGKAVATGNRPWNFWSGQQTSLRIWSALRSALIQQLKTICCESPCPLFQEKIPLTGRFGFDPESAWNALDAGFSPDAQQIPVASSPVIELLAAIGIQRFRPEMAIDRQSFTYSTWGQPLAPLVAAAAASGAISVPLTQQFRAQVISRGSYGALKYSTQT